MNLGDRLVFSNGLLVSRRPRRALIWVYRRRRQLADPPVRDRRVHRVHAFPARDGAVLAPRARPEAGTIAPSSTASARRQRPSSPQSWSSRSSRQARGIVTIAIPGLVLLCYGIRRHYRGVERRLRAGAEAVIAAPRRDEYRAGYWSSRLTRRRWMRSGSSGPRPTGATGRSTCRGCWWTRAIKQRWFRFADEQSRLELLDGSLGLSEAASSRYGDCRGANRTS